MFSTITVCKQTQTVLLTFLNFTKLHLLNAFRLFLIFETGRERFGRQIYSRWSINDTDANNDGNDNNEGAPSLGRQTSGRTELKKKMPLPNKRQNRKSPGEGLFNFKH